MADAVRVMQNQNASIASENDQLRRENHALMLQLRGQPPQQAPPPPPAAGYASDPYAHRPELPPLRALNGGPPSGPESMTGVQYDAPRANGYRPAERY